VELQNRVLVKKIITTDINYTDGVTTCRGFVAYPENANNIPCVLVAHDWTGRDEAVCDKACQLAEMGYVAFAIDMYGQATLGKTKVENRALMMPLRENRRQLVSRISAGFKAASQLPVVDSANIAAIGYCFGGLCVLDLARSGADLKGVVSFHGLLSSSPVFNEDKVIPAKILVLHGYDDPLVPMEEVDLFAQEMTQKKADWQVHVYGLTAHSFTNPKANDDEMGLHYNKTADERSWASTLMFLREVFAIQ